MDKKNYKYSLKKLREDISKSLVLLKKTIILGYFKSYLKKMRLYREIIQYEIGE